ncbi:unnamed protein product [Ectocarpus sp. 6 AP-2014]
MGACRFGHLSIVNTLLAAGADVTIQTNSGVSALNKAVCNGHIDVIGALFRHGADVNACDDDGCTPLHVAAREDQAGAIDALMQAGANIESSSEGGSLAPLFFAINHCSLKAMHTLLRHGASFTVQDTGGNTPLHRACYYYVEYRQKICLRQPSGGPPGAPTRRAPSRRNPGGLRGAGCRNTPSASCCSKLQTAVAAL